jgi:phospholipase D
MGGRARRSRGPESRISVARLLRAAASPWLRWAYVARTVTILILALAAPACRAAATPAMVDTCFVPAERCAPRIVAAIDAARESIRVQAYGFTSPPILEALAAAHRRGVDVQVIVDRSAVERRYHGATEVAKAGIPIWIDFAPVIAHTKAIIIDGTLVIGGSFNYSQAAAQRNVEDVTFTQSRDIARRFLANWEQRRALSRLYEPTE